MLAPAPSFASKSCGSVDERIDRLVEDLIDLNSQSGDATRKRLLERGWSARFLDEYEAEARSRANVRFVRDVNEDPTLSLQAVEDQMVEIITASMPGWSFLEAQLRARGFSEQHIRLKKQRACGRAALAFAHGVIGAGPVTGAAA